MLAAAYVVIALTAPLPLLWCVQAASALQRARFRALLGVAIPAPPRMTGSRLLLPIRSWRTAATWRQLGYHLLAAGVGTAGGVLVATSWSVSQYVEERYATDLLSVQTSAVEKYISNIFAKLDLPPTETDHRRVLAVLKFLRT